MTATQQSVLSLPGSSPEAFADRFDQKMSRVLTEIEQSEAYRLLADAVVRTVNTLAATHSTRIHAFWVTLQRG